VIQVILESICQLTFPATSSITISLIRIVIATVLRREKKMKDKDGNPIVTLPEKRISVVHLDFSKEEREIYEALYKNAKSKFLGYAQEGTVLSFVFFSHFLPLTEQY